MHLTNETKDGWKWRDKTQLRQYEEYELTTESVGTMIVSLKSGCVRLLPNNIFLVPYLGELQAI